MKKPQKRYYIIVVILALICGMFLRYAEKESFRIVKNSTVYAPESEIVVRAEETEEVQKININEADVLQLDALHGIGESLAERIIEYRTKNGKFEVIQDIMKVNGIGETTFNEIKELICVE